LLPAAASAATSCSFDAPTHVLTVTESGGTSPGIVRSGAEIVVTQSAAPVNCGPTTPTIDNTDTINIVEGGAQGTVFAVSVAGGELAPGFSAEGTGSSEIEINITAEPTGTDQFAFTGTDGAENLQFASLGVNVTGGNLNGAETPPDTDVNATNVDRLFLAMGAGPDVINGGAGALVPGSVGALAVDLAGVGGAGDDAITAGNSNGNTLDGGADDDDLTGGINADSIQPGPGNDTASGGAASTDTLSYRDLTEGVTVDLASLAPQDTGGQGTDTVTGFEDFVGTNASDQVSGTAGPNSLFGGFAGDTGSDVLLGLGGNDILTGAGGDDVLTGGSADDSMSGGAGIDTVSYSSGSTAGVVVNLDPIFTGSPQQPGGAGTDTLVDDGSTPGTNHLIENIDGSPFDDNLSGSPADNRVVGNAGEDTIVFLSAGGGTDLFHAYDGEHDVVICNDSSDEGIADELTPAPGVDLLLSCGVTDHAPQTSIASGPGDGAASTDTTPLYALSSDEPADFEFSLDGGGFEDCSASCEVTDNGAPLPLGSHAIAFRAVDQDEGGLVDLTPVTTDVLIVEPPLSTPPATTTPPTDTAAKKKCKRKKRKGGRRAKCKRKPKRP
jgi:Ca2+-binding RTX toxin-like protein